MTNIFKALLWAALILIVAAYSSTTELGSAESFAITMGLVGAAMATLKAPRKAGCAFGGKGCA